MKRGRKENEGEFATLYKKLIDDDSKVLETFCFQYFRMPQNCFNINV